MAYTYEYFQAAADFLRTKTDITPEIGIVLGSCLGPFAQAVENPVTVDYAEIPHFLLSTVASHAGKLIFGTVAGRRVVCMSGRFHSYEGYSFEEVSYAVRVLKLVGCSTLIVTNAAGCVNTAWKAGDLMLITDQIKMFSESPLRGENLPEFGVRFPDASPHPLDHKALVPGLVVEQQVPVGPLLLLRTPPRDTQVLLPELPP